MRRYVAAASLSQTTRIARYSVARVCWRAGSLSFWCHGILERTLGGKVVAAADTAFDLHLLQLLGLLILLRRLLLLLPALEADHGPEDDVLAQSSGIRSWPCRFACLYTHLRPLSSLCNARVLLLLDDSPADALCAFDFLALFVNEDGHYRLCAVLVPCDLWCRH